MANEEAVTRAHEPGHDLHLGHEDKTIRALHRVIRVAVKVLAVLMVLVIVWGIGDLIYVLYQRLTEPPFIYGTAAVVAALGVTYWLTTRRA